MALCTTALTLSVPVLGAPVPAASSAEAAGQSATAELDAPLPSGDERRRRPDYGRPPEPSSSAKHALWLPRLILAPAYVASDLVSRPLAALAIIAEKNHWRVRLYDFFTFGAENQIGVFPTGRIDTGFDPSVGVYAFWNDVWRASDIRAHGMTGGSSWWSADVQWRVPLGPDTLTLVVAFSKRPDSAFHGLGNDSPPEAARFDEQRLETRLRYRVPVAPNLALTAVIGQQWVVYDASGAAGPESSLASAIEAGRLSAPPALDGGLLAAITALRMDLDTRAGRFTPNPRLASDYARVSGMGVAVGGYVEHHTGLRKTRAEPGEEARYPAWLGYGGRVLGAVDVTGTQRRLELELYSAFTEPLRGAGDVPFTEQVSLGGARPLRGFGSRRLIDRSAAVATLRYRWPVWTALDGVLHYAVGGVFGPELRGFGLSRLRASLGAGITTVTHPDQAFEALLAFGTETFEAGGAVESTRFTVGTSINF